MRRIFMRRLTRSGIRTRLSGLLRVRKSRGRHGEPGMRSVGRCLLLATTPPAVLLLTAVATPTPTPTPTLNPPPTIEPEIAGTAEVEPPPREHATLHGDDAMTVFVPPVMPGATPALIPEAMPAPVTGTTPETKPATVPEA